MTTKTLTPNASDRLEHAGRLITERDYWVGQRALAYLRGDWVGVSEADGELEPLTEELQRAMVGGEITRRRR